MPLWTVKIKPKKRPLWGYMAVSLLSLPICALWAWIAYSGIGFSRELARQMFIAFSVLQLLFCPLLWLANERQVRDHRSRALLATATTFTALFAAAVLYFIGRHEHDVISPIIFGSITIGIAVCLISFGIKWEFE